MPELESGDSDWALFSAYRDRIHRYILGMVRDAGEAEDLTQETFLRAYRSEATMREPNAARGWLYRVATNLCLDQLRKRTPQISLDDAEAAGRINQAVTAGPSAQEMTERKETSVCVQRCLDFLSDSYRAVILLHDANGLTSAQIAELLGVEPGAVKIRLHRARLKLHQLMEHGCVVSEDQGAKPVCQPKCGITAPAKPG
jgi:RNA polymerase sigma-70 factor (ECF subfamily)